jgi:hypothetical protein
LSPSTAPSRLEAIRRLVELGLAVGQRAGVRTEKLEKRQKWQVRKSTAGLTTRQPTKNGNSARGGFSRDPKSSAIYVASLETNERISSSIAVLEARAS